MMEHIALIEKELKEIQKNYARAQARPGVKEEELINLAKKLRLKSEICSILKELYENGEVEMKKRYTIQASRKGEDKWSIWTTEDEYDEAAAHKRYCESVGYRARIIEDNGEE